MEGPPPPVTKDLIRKALRKMKCGKAAGPSGIIAEMLKAAGEVGIELLTELMEVVFCNGVIPTDWQESFILNLYKGKGDALERGNYQGLKLTDQVMKLLERVLDAFIREMVDIDAMQFGFVPGRGTTDAIFIINQLQEKYNKPLNFAFVDLEKAFDRVPRKVLWWALRSLGVEEWAVCVIQGMYTDVKSRVRVNGQYSKEFGVGVGVHQGSVLSPLLFIHVLEALSRQFHTGVPWELLYADDLAVMADSLEECIARLKVWKEGMERKGLRVNMKKTKLMVSGPRLDLLCDSGAFPCAVCRSGVGVNSIQCSQCMYWVHKKCSGVRGRLAEDPDYVCPRCCDHARPIDNRPVTQVDVDEMQLDVESNFCYLGDILCAGGGCKLATVTRYSTAWGKFKKFLPSLTSKHVSLRTRRKVFNACVSSALLHGSQTWAPTAPDLQRLSRNNRSMVRWICGVRDDDEVSSDSLCAMLGVQEVTAALRTRRLRWYGHVERSSSCINSITSMTIPSARRRGRPKKTWSECVKTDMKMCSLGSIDPLNREAWGLGVRHSSHLLPTPVPVTPAAVEK